MRFKILLLLAGIILPVYTLFAKVTRVEIERREVILNGATFGKYGQYEYISGKIWFEIDPGNLYNSRITDIHLALP
ncbi:MAG: hypothetical protein R2744_11250 [Bacteroidales bacterium]